MKFSAEFSALLKTIESETRVNQQHLSSLGNAVISQTRQAHGCTFDCYFTGENIVAFSWVDPDGNTFDDHRVADISVYRTTLDKIIPDRAELSQFVLTASGIIVERIGGREAEATSHDAAFLLSLFDPENVL